MVRRSQRLMMAALKQGHPPEVVTYVDPMKRLPDLCIDDVFSYLTPVELIGIQRVSKLWRYSVDWRFGREVYWKKYFKTLATDDGKVGYNTWEEASQAFKKAVYRRETKTYGEPTYVQKFTGVHQGWAVCGDYFVWIDTEALIIQRIFDAEHPGRMPGSVRRIKLTRLFKQHIHEHPPRIEYIQAQETGVLYGPPLLALFCVCKKPQLGHACRLVTIIDIESGKRLWSHYEAKGASHHYALNHKTMSYTHTIHRGNDITITLKVLDVMTGKLKSNTRLDFQPRVQVNRMKAHPRRELIFMMLPDEVLVFSTITHDWVGRLKLPELVTTGRSRDYQPFLRWPWDLTFDEYGPSGAGAREMLIVFGVQGVSNPSKDYWITHKFELPTEKELESENGGFKETKFPKETVESKPKPIKNWIRRPVEVIWTCGVVPTNGYNGFNPKARQLCIRDVVSRKLNKLAIVSYKEEEDQSGMFHLSEVPEEVVPVDGKEDLPAKIKYYTVDTKNDVTKMKKRMPKKTTWRKRRALLPMPKAAAILAVPAVKERCVVFYQGGTDVFLLSFAPRW